MRGKIKLQDSGLLKGEKILPAKITKYICSECGHVTTTKTGKCPSCNSWGTLEILPEVTPTNTKNISSHVKIINALDVKTPERISTGIEEFDRVLGGGLVPGSVILIGGQPGIGKSTLLLQAAGSVAKNYNRPVLYISGEESDAQVALRASRINTASENLYLYSGSELEDALTLYKIPPELIRIEITESINDEFN